MRVDLNNASPRTVSDSRRMSAHRARIAGRVAFVFVLLLGHPALLLAQDFVASGTYIGNGSDWPPTTPSCKTAS